MFAIKYVILGVLGVLAAEDLRHKAVTIWKLALFGGVCIVQSVIKARVTQTADINLFLGILFCVLVLVICVGTDRIGAADGMVIIFLGMAVGGAEMLRIFVTSLFIMGIFSLPLFLTGKIHSKFEIPMIPFIFLAVVWNMM